MAAPYDAPIPGAPGQINAALLAKTAYQNTLARINRQRGDTMRQYGYAGDVDPTSGVITNMRVDPNNPYGNLQSMFRAHALQDQSAEWANEERGLHGGLAHKADTDLRYSHGSESANLGQQFTGQITDYQDAQTQAAYERDRALYEAQLQDAQNAIAAGNYNPAYAPDEGNGNGGADPNQDYGNAQNTGGGGATAVFTNPYIAAAAAAVANGYGGYVNAPGGGGTKSAPTPKPYSVGGFTQASKFVAAAKKKKKGGR